MEIVHVKEEKIQVAAPSVHVEAPNIQLELQPTPEASFPQPASIKTHTPVQHTK